MMATNHSLSLRTKRPREEDDHRNATAGSMIPDLADCVEEHTRPRKQAKMALPSCLKPLMINNSSANRKAKTDAALKAVQRGLLRRLGDRYQHPESENTDTVSATVDEPLEVVDAISSIKDQEAARPVDRITTLDASTQTSEVLLGDHAESRSTLLSLPSTSLRRTSTAVYYCAFNRIWSEKPCEECALKDWGGPLEVIEEESEDEKPAGTASGQERHMSIDSDNASTIVLAGGYVADRKERNPDGRRHSPLSDKENTQAERSSDYESGLDEDSFGGAYLNEDALQDVEDYIEGSSSGDEDDRSSGDEEDLSSSGLSAENTVGCYMKEDDSEDSTEGGFKPAAPPLKHGDEVVSSSSGVSECEVYYED